MFCQSLVILQFLLFLLPDVTITFGCCIYHHSSLLIFVLKTMSRWFTIIWKPHKISAQSSTTSVGIPHFDFRTNSLNSVQMFLHAVFLVCFICLACTSDLGLCGTFRSSAALVLCACLLCLPISGFPDISHFLILAVVRTMQGVFPPMMLAAAHQISAAEQFITGGHLQYVLIDLTSFVQNSSSKAGWASASL